MELYTQVRYVVKDVSGILCPRTCFPCILSLPFTALDYIDDDGDDSLRNFHVISFKCSNI